MEADEQHDVSKGETTRMCNLREAHSKDFNPNLIQGLREFFMPPDKILPLGGMKSSRLQAIYCRFTHKCYSGLKPLNCSYNVIKIF
jgi:hypothetical protein